jgi:hypothetical protein
VRPDRLAADDGRPLEIERLGAADANRVADRLAAGLNEIEPALGNVDDDRPRPIGRFERHDPAKQVRVHRREIETGNREAVVFDRSVDLRVIVAAKRQHAGRRLAFGGDAPAQQQAAAEHKVSTTENDGHLAPSTISSTSRHDAVWPTQPSV